MNDPVSSVVVLTVIILVFQLNTNTIGSPLSPTPIAVNVPETVKDPSRETELGFAETVSDVETGFDSFPVLRFRVIVPGPRKLTTVGSFELEQAKFPEQFQLENV